MLVKCQCESKDIMWTNPETGEKEQLYDLDLICFGTPAAAMTNGVNMDGTPCFDSEGRFNGKKIAPFSQFMNVSSDAAKIISYWDFENQTWG